jgi:hypothetical protein
MAQLARRVGSGRWTERALANRVAEKLRSLPVSRGRDGEVRLEGEEQAQMLGDCCRSAALISPESEGGRLPEG